MTCFAPSSGTPPRSRTSGGASALRTIATDCPGSSTYGLPRSGCAFLSIEPLLEDLALLNLSGIDWVIVGGESGHGARPMDPDWVRSIRDQCSNAGVPFFFKQWGGLLKKRNGRELDGRTYDEMPQRVDRPVPNLLRRREMIAEVQVTARSPGH